MNEQALQTLYELAKQDGYANTFEDFSLLLSNNEEAVSTMFNLAINNGYENSIEDFSELVGFVKKKDEIEPTTVSELEVGLSEPTPDPKKIPIVAPTTEKDTAIERLLGKNPVTNFFGDLYRSGVQGIAQGATVDDALKVFRKGEAVTDEDLQDYIAAVNKMESFAPSDEMQAFSKIYEEEGKGVLGFLKGVAKNKSVIPQLFISSLAAMINKGSLSAGVGAGGVGAAAGSVAPGIGTLAGGIGGAIGGLSGALETGLAYTEFLQEELAKKNLPFDDKGIREILADETAMNRITNRALGRGISIAAIDAFTGGIASNLTRKTAKAVGKLAATGVGIGTEAIGGATGEAVARAVADQEMDVAEIGFEGIAGTATAPITITAGLLKAPRYKLNGGSATRKQVETLLNEGTPEEIAGANITITNNKELYDRAQEAKQDAILGEKIKKTLPKDSEVSNDKLKELVSQFKVVRDLKENETATTEEITNAENKYKELKDAISKPSPEKVDVQKPTEDRPEVGVRDTEEPSAPRKVTPEPIKEEAKPAEEIEVEAEVAPSEVERFPTKRIKVTQPYTFGQIEVTFNDEGIVEKIQNKKTRKPVSFNTQKKVEEKILNNVIDVDAGKKAEVPEGITEQEINKFIADNSNNIREIVETIDVETKNIKEKKSQDIIDFNKLIDQGFKFTSESWKKMTGKSPKQSRLGKFWIDDTVDSVTGKPNGLSVEDGWASILARPDELAVDTTSRIDVNDVIKFIQDNSTIAKIKSQKKDSFVKSPTLIDLEIKFEELTGIKPTPRNIDVVLNIPEGRTPLEIAKLEEQAKLKKEAAEPGVFTEKKKGPKPEDITKPPGKPKKIVVDEGEALRNKLRELEKVSEKAMKEGEKKIKQQVSFERRLSSLRNTARKNIKKGKLGVSDAGVTLSALFNIKPSLIKEAIVDKKLNLQVYEDYLSLLSDLGKRKAVVKVQDIDVESKKAQDILNIMNEYLDRDIDETEVKPVVITQKQINKSVSDASKIKLDQTDINKFDNESEKDLVRKLQGLKNKDIKELVSETEDGRVDMSRVQRLKEVKEAIKGGIIPNKIADELYRVIQTKKQSKQLKTPISKITKEKVDRNLRNVLSKIKTSLLPGSPSGKNILLDRLRSGPAAYIDDLFGNFNNTLIYDYVYRPLAKAYESYKTDMINVQREVESAEKILGQGKTNNKVVESKYKIRLYQLAREHENNIVDGKSNKKAPPALALLNETIEAAEDGVVSSKMDAEYLNVLKDKYEKNGEIKSQDVLNDLSSTEKKALEIYDNLNNSLADKALFISTLRGNKIDLLNDYSHRVVLMDNRMKEAELQNKQSRFIRPSTKAATIAERVTGARPISFDPSLSALRGSQETYIDYHMTSPIKDVTQLINRLKNEFKKSPDVQKDAINAMQNSVEEILGVTYLNSFTDINARQSLASQMKRIGYEVVLGSLPRFVSETLSNMNMMISEPKIAAEAINNYIGLSLGKDSSNLGFNILKNLNSTETSKLFDKESSDNRYAELDNIINVSRDRAQFVSDFENKLGYIANSTIKPYIQGVRKIASGLMSGPDKAITRPMWYAKFADSFAKYTKQFNKKEVKLTPEEFRKIADKTSIYLDPEYKKAVDAATKDADRLALKIATSTNPFNSISKNMSRPGNGWKNIYREANSYMARFALFEYATARSAIGALLRKGDISQDQAAGLLAGVMGRMTSYVVVYNLLSSWMDGLAGVEEEEEEDYGKLIQRQALGSFLTLTAGGSLGNIPRIPVNLLIEEINRGYLEDLRDGKDYNPYETSLVFSTLTREDLMNRKPEELMVEIFAGPYGPLTRAAFRSIELAKRAKFRKTKEARERAVDELTERMSLEAAGNIGLIPFFKDFRRIALKKRFSDDDKQQLSKEQLKKYNPRLYKKLYD
jgi:hypothetical protein